MAGEIAGQVLEIAQFMDALAGYIPGYSLGRDFPEFAGALGAFSGSSGRSWFYELNNEFAAQEEIDRLLAEIQILTFALNYGGTLSKKVMTTKIGNTVFRAESIVVTGSRQIGTSGLRLPFKDSRLNSQIEAVVKSMDETGKPPPGVWQGGRRGMPQGTFLNDRHKLPDKPHGYYTESDIWPGSPGNRSNERLVFGKGGEVYFSYHYESFVRIR